MCVSVFWGCDLTDLSMTSKRAGGKHMNFKTTLFRMANFSERYLQPYPKSFVGQIVGFFCMPVLISYGEQASLHKTIHRVLITCCLGVRCETLVPKVHPAPDFKTS